MWGLAYIITALIAPWVGDSDIGVNAIIFAGLGAWTLLSLVALYSNRPLVGRISLFSLGVAEVFGGIASWVGIGIWNVPFPNKELFQVSMAFADLISAVFMFILAIESKQ